MPKAYSRRQIRLHWLVFILVVVQFVLNDSIHEAWHKVERGIAFEPSPLVISHVAIGFLLLALTIWRLIVRKRRGVPALPENEPPLMKLAAHVAHISLYVLMFLIPISGAVAWFGPLGLAAEGHELLTSLLLFVGGAHVAAALYHQFVLKTNLMDRMRTPDTE